MKLDNLIKSSGGINDGEILTKGPTPMGRRHFLKLLAVGVAAAANMKCGDEKEDNPPTPPPPEPVYKLKFGLYDNFDGQGGHQDYDNSELAVAGQLSSQLWGSGPSSTVVDNPTGNLMVFNENNQFVKYGWEDREVQRVIQYLQENVRPVSYFEREQFEKFLNPKGKDLVARIEEKDIEKQHKILQYVLSNRKSFFNPKGLKLDEMMHEKNAKSFMTYETLNDITEAGFKEDEIMALFYLQQEVDLYNGNLRRKIRETGRKGIERVKTAFGIETRIEPVEYKYTFNAKGELIDAGPHVPGQPYHGSKLLKWVDRNGKVHATAQTIPGIYAQSASGYVVKMEVQGEGGPRLALNNPDDIEFKDYKSWSADVMLSSKSTAKEASGGLDYHTSIPEQGGASWYCGIGLINDPRAGYAYAMANMKNKNTNYQVWEQLQLIEFDRWYKLRMDIETKDDDPNLEDTQFRVKFFVNGKEKASEIPENSAILIDPNRTEFGPKRSFQVYNPEELGSSIIFVDNVKAVYKNRTQ